MARKGLVADSVGTDRHRHFSRCLKLQRACLHDPACFVGDRGQGPWTNRPICIAIDTEAALMYGIRLVDFLYPLLLATWLPSSIFHGLHATCFVSFRFCSLRVPLRSMAERQGAALPQMLHTHTTLSAWHLCHTQLSHITFWHTHTTLSHIADPGTWCGRRGIW